MIRDPGAGHRGPNELIAGLPQGKCTGMRGCTRPAALLWSHTSGFTGESTEPHLLCSLCFGLLSEATLGQDPTGTVTLRTLLGA